MLWTINFHFGKNGDIDHINRLATDITRRVKAELSRELRPAVLDDLGLFSAMRSLLKLESTAGGFQYMVEGLDSDRRYTPEIETACYRIAQEAITNILNHSGANVVRFKITANPAILEIEIIDNGNGFDVAESRKRAVSGKSLGLISMSERAALVGGKLEISSVISEGTIIRVLLPIESDPR